MSLLREEGIGRLTADPEVKTVKIGGEDVPVAEFTVACDADFGKEDTDFVKVIAWRKLAETAANHLSKGRMIYFSGRPKNRSYENKDSQKVYTHEVQLETFQFLDSAKKDETSAAAPATAASAKPANRRIPF